MGWWFCGVVLSGFARIFWFLDDCGRVEGLDGVSPPGSAAWSGRWVAGWLGLLAAVAGWPGLLASFFVMLLFQISKK